MRVLDEGFGKRRRHQAEAQGGGRLQLQTGEHEDFVLWSQYRLRSAPILRSIRISPRVSDQVMITAADNVQT